MDAKDNQPLSLRAKLLKFRNAVSVGAATAHNSLENENMKRNPFFKTFYEKAAKEGRKVKFSERLKAALQFSAAKHEVRMIHKKHRQHSGILPPTIAVTDDNRESQTLFCRRRQGCY